VKPKSYNDCCPGHILTETVPGNIVVLPPQFEIEAEALRSGGMLIETASDFAHIPPLDKQQAIKDLLGDIGAARETNPRKTLVLEASGPYSILAALAPPALLYRALAKEAGAVHEALEAISAGLTRYLCAAREAGVNVISLADPYANREILGSERFDEFALAYLKEVIAALDAPGNPGCVIHTCPYLGLSEHGQCIHSLIYANTSFSYQESR